MTINQEQTKTQAIKIKQYVCLCFVFVAKYINFAAENEHIDKGWLDLNNNQWKSVFKKDNQ